MLKTRSSLAAEMTGAAEQAFHAAGAALEQGKELAGETATAAQRSLLQYASAARRSVSDEPIRSALIAAALGAVAATVVLALLRRRR